MNKRQRKKADKKTMRKTKEWCAAFLARPRVLIVTPLTDLFPGLIDELKRRDNLITKKDSTNES
jgi:hypothetical protein